MKFEGLIIQQFDMEHQWGLCVTFRRVDEERWRHAVRLPEGASGKEVADFLRSFADCIEYNEHKEST